MGTVCPHAIYLSMMYKQMGNGTQIFFPVPISNLFSSDISKLFLSLFLFPGRKLL